MNDLRYFLPFDDMRDAVIQREEGETNLTRASKDPHPAGGGRRRGRGRRPEAEVRADILLGAGRLLFEDGMAALTIEGVAPRAGASKTTIYKWWESKGALALDGYLHAVEETRAFPYSGNVIDDLRLNCEPSSTR